MSQCTQLFNDTKFQKDRHKTIGRVDITRYTTVQGHKVSKRPTSNCWRSLNHKVHNCTITQSFKRTEIKLGGVDITRYTTVQ